MEVTCTTTVTKRSRSQCEGGGRQRERYQFALRTQRRFSRTQTLLTPLAEQHPPPPFKTKMSILCHQARSVVRLLRRRRGESWSLEDQYIQLPPRPLLRGHDSSRYYVIIGCCERYPTLVYHGINNPRIRYTHTPMWERKENMASTHYTDRFKCQTLYPGPS